jgi:hypothetical protein
MKNFKIFSMMALIVAGLWIQIATAAGAAPCNPCAFYITPEQFGAHGDGVSDDTAAVDAALASLEPGGRILLTGKYLIASGNLNIPPNVTMEGTFQAVGAGLINGVTPFALLNSAVILNSNYTISLGGGSAIKGLLIYRQGQVFPAADATGFAGTAITIAGDDASVIGCMIIGFNQGIFSSGFDRQYYDHVLGDNLNFIAVINSYDIGRMMDCHAWNFATITYPGQPPSDVYDRQTAYYLNGAAWFKATNCFALGYNYGFNLVDTQSVTLMGCGVDGTSANPNSTGINIYGLCYETRIDTCQVAGQAVGIAINTEYPGVTTRIVTQIVNSDMWGNIGNAGEGQNIVVYAGDVEVIGCHIRNSNSAINLTNASTRAIIDGNSFDETVYNPIYNEGGSPNVYIGINDYGNAPIGYGVVANMKLPTATTGTGALAGVLLLPPSGDVFSIVPTAGNITSINGSFDGRVKTLLFNGVHTITSFAGDGGIRLSNNASFTTAPGTTLSIILSPEGYWMETGRSNP